MTRRIVACTLVGGFLLCGAVAVADNEQCRVPKIEGTWLSVVYYLDENLVETPAIQFLTTFTRDGRTTILLPFGPDQKLGESPSEPTENLYDSRIGCTGEWRQAGKRTFDVTMYCLWRQNPGVKPDLIRYKLTLDKSGKYLTGPFKYRYNDPVFPPEYLAEEEYTLKSVRLGLVPLD
jgi:hypothetical protein